MRRRVSASLAALLGLALLVLLSAPPAAAHAYLSTSNPVDGAALASAPSELQLGFSESVVLGATSLDLVDSRGLRYQPTDLRIVSSSSDTEDPVTLFARLPQLPHNAYRLSWATLSRDDLHRTSGVIVFGVGQAVVAAGTHEPLPPRDEVGLRWLLFTGFALTLGGLLAARLIARRSDDGTAARRCYRIAAVAAAGSAGSAAALLVIQSWAAGLSTALSGRYGLGWMSREGGLVLLAIIAAGHGQRLRTRAGFVGVFGSISVGAVTVGSALVGHNASGGPSYLIADAVHLAATAAWTGCPLVLVLASRRRPGTLRAALLGFAGPAAGFVAAIVATGLYLSSGVVGSVDASISTFYGRALLLKLMLFGIVAGFGLLNFRLLRRAPAVPVRATVVAETVAAVLVLGLAAVLTSSQPAQEPEFRQVAAVATTTQDGLAEDLQQTVSIKPNLPGKNMLLLGIFDTRRPAPGEITQVRVELVSASGTITVQAQPLADRTWGAPVELGASRRTSVRVSVYRAGVAPVSSSYDWTVQAAPQSRRAVLLSQAPIRSALQRLAITVLALAIAAAGLLALLRRARRGSGLTQPEAGNPTEDLVTDSNHRLEAAQPEAPGDPATDGLISAARR